MNFIQRSVVRFLKAVGFPVWTGSTTDIPPGGWGAWDWNGDKLRGLELSSVFGCCRVLCGAIGSLPLHIFRLDENGIPVKYADHPLYSIVHDRPNVYQTSMEFREALVLGYCLYGNGFAEIVRSGKRITSLIPMRADRVRIILNQDGLSYQYYGNSTNGTVKPEVYRPEQVLHFKNFALDGINGITPLRPDLVNHGLVAQTYGLNFLRNGAKPAGALTMPKGTKLGDVETVKNDWKKLHSGADKAGSVAVLFDGMTYQDIGFNPDQAQFIETLEMINKQVSACYGVPPTMLGITDRTATYAASEQFDLQFAKHVVRPLAEKMEQAFNKALLAGEANVYCKMDMDELQRGDTMSQAEWFAKVSSNGGITRNEWRKKMNLPGMEGGDSLTVQSQMVELKDLPKLSASAAANPGTAPGDIRK